MEQSSFTWQAYIKASITTVGNFGQSVSLGDNGNTLVVGAIEDSNSTGINSTPNHNSITGAAYAFHYNGNDWYQKAYIKPAFSEWGYRFGHSVSVSDDGSNLVVGDIHDRSTSTGINSTPTGLLSQSGAVYLY